MARKLKLTTHVDLVAANFVKMWADLREEGSSDYAVFAEKADGTIVTLVISNSWEIAETALHLKARGAGLNDYSANKVGFYTR